MNDNVVIDFLSKKKEREEKLIEIELEDNENIHDICTTTANKIINALDEDYGLDVQKIEYSAEMIFFFEAYKSLVMKCIDQWHPFQDIAQEFMEEQGITVELGSDGNYLFVFNPPNDE